MLCVFRVEIISFFLFGELINWNFFLSILLRYRVENCYWLKLGVSFNNLRVCEEHTNSLNTWIESFFSLLHFEFILLFFKNR